jgi:hypothetical protein
MTLLHASAADHNEKTELLSTMPKAPRTRFDTERMVYYSRHQCSR